MSTTLNACATSVHRIARAWERLFFLMLFTIAPLSAQAANVFCQNNNCAGVIEIKGEISRGDYDKLSVALEGVDPVFISIDSPGGSIDEAMKIGQLLRNRELAVEVADSGECVSACVLILAGAVHRLPNDRVGIHRGGADP